MYAERFSALLTRVMIRESFSRRREFENKTDDREERSERFLFTVKITARSIRSFSAVCTRMCVHMRFRSRVYAGVRACLLARGRAFAYAI
jgi:hypothetical protein